MAKSFRELKVWNISIELTTAIYRLTENFPKSELYGLSSQMRRAAVSIASNIAEGSARTTRKDFKHFVTLARGSNNELQTQLVIAQRLGYASSEETRRVEASSHEIGQMLSGLSKYLSTPKVNE
ncbi:MAG: four helix bundle protein [Acidobacteriaceae bacterium]